MRRLPIKLAIAFLIMSIIIFGGCILFAMNLYTEANLSLSLINAQYNNEEVIRTSNSWINSTPLVYTDGISVNDYRGYNAIYQYNSTDFVSYSEHWDEAKLHDLAIELYNKCPW